MRSCPALYMHRSARMFCCAFDTHVQSVSAQVYWRNDRAEYVGEHELMVPRNGHIIDAASAVAEAVNQPGLEAASIRFLEITNNRITRVCIFPVLHLPVLCPVNLRRAVTGSTMRPECYKPRVSPSGCSQTARAHHISCRSAKMPLQA